MLQYPGIFRVRQHFERPRVVDIESTVDAELSSLGLADTVRPGQTVAITAGSRGIANIPLVIRACVRHFQRLGAKPFIVPAMGSHGGGTAEGQTAIINHYGITEEFLGCPIRSSMETVVLCRAAEGFPVHFDKHAHGADHVLVVGRVKPHTDFVGPVESGLMKMMLIGLGKHEGAKVYHRAIQDYTFPQIIRSVAGEVLRQCPILAGLAILENGYDETAQITAVRAAEIERREAELLIQARRWIPRLPFKVVDLLLVDELGKNISGAGMDTNVTGRKFDDHQAREDEWPKVRRIAVRGLTPATEGNASGIGMSEFCLTRVIDQIDIHKTRVNCLTSGHIGAAMFPLDFPTDAALLDAALPTIGLREAPDARLIWIRNTLDLAEVECSAAYLDEARGRDDLEILTPVRPLPLDAAGMLPDSLHALAGPGARLAAH